MSRNDNLIMSHTRSKWWTRLWPESEDTGALLIDMIDFFTVWAPGLECRSRVLGADAPLGALTAENHMRVLVPSRPWTRLDYSQPHNVWGVKNKNQQFPPFFGIMVTGRQWKMCVQAIFQRKLCPFICFLVEERVIDINANIHQITYNFFLRVTIIVYILCILHGEGNCCMCTVQQLSTLDPNLISNIIWRYCTSKWVFFCPKWIVSRNGKHKMVRNAWLMKKLVYTCHFGLNPQHCHVHCMYKVITFLLWSTRPRPLDFLSLVDREW